MKKDVKTFDDIIQMQYQQTAINTDITKYYSATDSKKKKKFPIGRILHLLMNPETRDELGRRVSHSYQ